MRTGSGLHMQAKLEGKVESNRESILSGTDSKLAQMETRLTRRMFNFWIAQAATTAALVFAVVKLAH